MQSKHRGHGPLTAYAFHPADPPPFFLVTPSLQHLPSQAHVRNPCIYLPQGNPGMDPGCPLVTTERRYQAIMPAGQPNLRPSSFPRQCHTPTSPTLVSVESCERQRQTGIPATKHVSVVLQSRAPFDGADRGRWLEEPQSWPLYYTFPEE